MSRGEINFQLEFSCINFRSFLGTTAHCFTAQNLNLTIRLIPEQKAQNLHQIPEMCKNYSTTHNNGDCKIIERSEIRISNPPGDERLRLTKMRGKEVEDES